MSPKGSSTDTAPVYEIPSGTGEVKLTATPTDSPSPYWDQTVFLTVGTNSLSAKQGSEGFVVLSKSTTLGDPPVTFAKVLLSWFKDYTTETLRLLGNPPKTRHIYDWDTNKWSDPDPVVDEISFRKRIWGTFPPPDWKLHDVPDAHFLDLATPVNKSAGTLNFVNAPPAIDVDSLVLRLAGVDAPQLFAVTWPKVLAPKANASPTPFFIFIRQENIGNYYDRDGTYVGGELDSQPYPNNFDYANTLFEQLNYGQSPLDPPPLHNARSPLLWPDTKGVPYQVAKAGADVVTVIPCNAFRKEFGFMEDTDQTGLVLQELQAFMFLRAGIQAPPASVGKTAIASFSSGNFYLGRWLAKASNVNGNFLSNVVSAVYFLDPILETDPKKTDVKTFVKAAMEWAAKKADKRIRLYTRFQSDAHVKLLGKALGGLYIETSADKKRTAAVLSNETWAATFKKVTGGSMKPNFPYSHHVIAATMLTHALAQGDLKP